MQQGKFKDPFGNEIKILSNSFVEANGEFLPLCAMCKKSRLTCENVDIRQVPDPDAPITFISIRLEDGTIHEAPSVKHIDGVEAGIIKTEQDVPIPLVCIWFDIKNPG